MRGEFVRHESGFRDWVRADGSTPFAPEAGRYHLYVSFACPWAHRTLVMRRLKGLERAISVSVVDPVWNENGWTFSDYPGSTRDQENGCHDLIDVYRLARPGYDGVESTPVLWDKKRKTIVNNESREIIRMMDREMDAIADHHESYCPRGEEARIDAVIDELYPRVNNGVYRAGFATTQEAYESAVRSLFAALDGWEKVLSSQPYLCGERLTEADICFYTTLVRFDAVYYGHFKCNLRRITEFPALWRYLRKLYWQRGFADTTDFDHIKRHYYMSQTSINPTRIVPVGPVLDFKM